jgi:hypothetical protein
MEQYKFSPWQKSDLFLAYDSKMFKKITPCRPKPSLGGKFLSLEFIEIALPLEPIRFLIPNIEIKTTDSDT